MLLGALPGFPCVPEGMALDQDPLAYPVIERFDTIKSRLDQDGETESNAIAAALLVLAQSLEGITTAIWSQRSTTQKDGTRE